jgi:transposase
MAKKLEYCLPYHSKYNPIERVWGVLGKHWNGQLSDHIVKIIGLAKTIKYKSNHQSK